MGGGEEASDQVNLYFSPANLCLFERKLDVIALSCTGCILHPAVRINCVIHFIGKEDIYYLFLVERNKPMVGVATVVIFVRIAV